MTYIVMALDKRINEYETTGLLFASLKNSLIELTLWKRVLSVLPIFMERLCEIATVTADELPESVLLNGTLPECCTGLAGVLLSLRKQKSA